MSLHLLSVILMSISANTDSFAVAVTYGIKQVRITILTSLLIAIVSSAGIFVSMSVGQIISGYLSHSIASRLGSGVLIWFGLLRIWQTLRQERKRRKIDRYKQQQNFSVSSFFYKAQLRKVRDNKIDKNQIDKSSNKLSNPVRSLGIKQSIQLAFSLTIDNIIGGIGAGISGLNIILTTGLNFMMAVIAIFSGTILGGKITEKTTKLWSGLLSSALIISIGIYEYLN
jgi:putative sporulation protein YtaF